MKFGYKVVSVKISRTESPYISNQRRNRVWLIRFALLIMLGLGLYYGYCWGLWGRHSLLLQYLFQCSCPAASTEARYPEEVDVIVPACRYVSSIQSPSGRLLYVQEKKLWRTSTYLLNLQTDEKIPFILSSEGSNYFLTDDLVYHSQYGNDEYILEISTGIKYPVKDATKLEPNVFSMGDIEPKLLYKALLKVDEIFFVDGVGVVHGVIALSRNIHNQPDNVYYFDELDFRGDEPDRVKQFLKENNIDYSYVSAIFPHELISPNGRFVARKEGIYLVETGQKIVGGYSPSGYYRAYSGEYFSVRGWTYDSNGALYSPFFTPCLLETNFLYFEYPGCFFRVSQPLLKLKAPEEYSLPAPTP